jgi:hypothetical protein
VRPFVAGDQVAARPVAVDAPWAHQVRSQIPMFAENYWIGWWNASPVTKAAAPSDSSRML